MSDSYKLAVVGSRSITDYALLCSILDPAAHLIDEIISGGAAGTDSMAEQWAKANDVPCSIIRPNWRPNGVYDKGAGFKRNIEIVKKADKILVLWDQKSRGSENTIDHCIRLNKPYYVVKVDQK